MRPHHDVFSYLPVLHLLRPHSSLLEHEPKNTILGQAVNVETFVAFQGASNSAGNKVCSYTTNKSAN